MIARIAFVVAAVALLLALTGRLARPKADRRRRRMTSAHACPSCGAWVVDGERCACGHDPRGPRA